MTLKSGVGSVQFYPDRPLLETELNELQSVQNEAREDIIRDSIPSGFTQLGDLDFDYMSSVDNKVKLKSDSVAFVNGMRIFIPKDTVIDLGNAPEKASREDLVFLEVWKEEVGADGTLTQYGGEGQASIPNHILDNRVKVETAKRVINRWRIRVVPNALFDSPRVVDGLGYSVVGNIDGDTEYPRIAFPQGGNLSPISHSSLGFNNNMSYTYCYRQASCKRWEWMKVIEDIGLFISGGSNESTNKTTLKTYDGYVYAIPMFRLYRKPSCGKAKPFEFRKICSLVDQSKFAKLVNSEKVEAVSDVDIKGASLVNKFTSPPSFIASSDNSSNNISVVKFDNGIKVTKIVDNTSSWAYLAMYNMLKANISPNSDYTILLTIKDRGYFTSRDSFEMAIQFPPGTNKVAVLTFTKLSGDVWRATLNLPIGIVLQPDHVLFLGLNSLPKDHFVEISNVYCVDGNITKYNLPNNYFNGISSLGEQEGNLVTVKSGVIEKDNIDPCTDTIKTSAYSGITNVLSPNKIIPSVEADLVRNGNVIESLTTLPYKTTNSQEGDLVRVNKVKGKTYQNLLKRDYCLNVGNSNEISIDSNIIMITNPTAYRFIRLNTTHTIYPNKEYTVILNVIETNSTKLQAFFESTDGLKDNSNTCTLVQGLNILKFTTKSESTVNFRISESVAQISKSRIHRDMIFLEGDHTNNPNLPSYFEGIKSVGEEEGNKITVKSVGKNLFNGTWNYNKGLSPTGSLGDNNTRNTTDFIRVKPSTTYIINGATVKGFAYYDNNLQTIQSNVSTPTTITTPQNCYYVRLNCDNSLTFLNLQIEEGTVATSYEPYKESVQTIPLKEPLRSLPNGVADSVEKVGNVYKVIRRVGKIVLNGSENGFAQGGLTNDTYFEGYGFEVYNHKDNISGDSSAGMSDRFIYNPKTTGNQEVCFINSTTKKGGIVIAKSKLTTPDLTGFKKWLQANPTTIYYELDTPITEDILHNFDRESARTYQLDSPLRSLPNGVKDEIKDGVLIRRCGQHSLISNVDLCTIHHNGANNIRFRFVIPGCRTSQNSATMVTYQCISDTIQIVDRNPVTNDSFEARCIYNRSAFIGDRPMSYFEIEKSALITPDNNGLKTWLQANPVTVVYELATPIEIPLKEVLPTSADYSLKRHLTATNYLRELPNGVKDTIEGGKVKRRVGRAVLNGSESWTISDVTTMPTSIAFFTDVIERRTGVRDNMFADRLNVVLDSSTVSNGLYGNISTKRVYIILEKSKLTTLDVDGLKKWLNANPLTVIYELATPTEEAITDTSIPTPCHPVNTYVGGLYVADGINHVYTSNNIPREEAPVVNTPFRQIGEVTTISDCKYKKHYDGCEMMEYGLGKNKLPRGFTFNAVSAEGVVVSNQRVALSGLASVLPNTNYSVNGVPSISSVPRYNFWTIDNKYISQGYGSSFVTPSNCRYVRIQMNTNDSSVDLTPSNLEVLANSIQLELGSIITPFEPYVKGELPLTSLQQNNVDDLRHKVSLTGFNYPTLLADSFDLALRGELQ